MLQINNNLKRARKLIKKTQEECEALSGINQKEISLLESGKREFIPNEYLFFLSEQGVDLNTVFKFDSNVTLQEETLAITSNIFRENSSSIEDKYLRNLQLQVEALTADKADMKKERDLKQRTIDELQEQLRFMRSNTDGRAKSA